MYLYVNIYHNDISIPKKGICPLIPEISTGGTRTRQADKSGHGQIDYDECGNLGDEVPYKVVPTSYKFVNITPINYSYIYNKPE